MENVFTMNVILHVGIAVFLSFIKVCVFYKSLCFLPVN